MIIANVCFLMSWQVQDRHVLHPPPPWIISLKSPESSMTHTAFITHSLIYRLWSLLVSCYLVLTDAGWRSEVLTVVPCLSPPLLPSHRRPGTQAEPSLLTRTLQSWPRLAGSYSLLCKARGNSTFYISNFSLKIDRLFAYWIKNWF